MRAYVLHASYLVEATQRIPPLDPYHTWLCTVFLVPVRWFPSVAPCWVSWIRCCPADRPGWQPKTKALVAGACPVWRAVDPSPRIRGPWSPYKSPPWPGTSLTRSSISSWRSRFLEIQQSKL